MTQVNAKTAVKQLKKNDFLAVITTSPMTRADIVNALADYTFIPTYLDYLTEHFVNQGKLVQNDDGTVQLKGKKTASGAARTKNRVVENDDGTYTLESLPLEKGEHLTKDCGWYATPGKAVKVKTSEIFKNYIESTKAVKSLIAVEEASAE